MLSMPLPKLPELRGYWLEETCCREPVRSSLWLHAARWPSWLLSDLALDHTCRHCGAMPALALLPQDRSGLLASAGRVELVDRFDGG